MQSLYFQLLASGHEGRQLLLSEVALAKIDVAQKLLQLGHLDSHEVDQGVGVDILCEEPFEEGTRGCEDHLVSRQLAFIFCGQGDIRQVSVKPEFCEDSWTFLVKVVPG